MFLSERSFASISLADLDAAAALQERIDRKYVLPVHRLPEVVADLPEDARILEIDSSREFAYVSLYLDTPELTAYYLACRRRRRRFKVRRRLYVDSGQAWLEVKTRTSRGVTMKQRTSDGGGPGPLNTDERSFVAAVLEQEGLSLIDPVSLVPVLRTAYRRTTFHLPGDHARMTVDVNLTVSNATAALRWDGLAIVETKAGSHPTQVDRLLWRRGIRPTRISKYGAGLAALDPDLPDQKWHRTLTHDIPVALAR